MPGWQARRLPGWLRARPGGCRRTPVTAGAGFALRTPFERQYVTAFSREAHPDAVRAYNATPPVRRKFFPGVGGRYRADAHYIVAPARWRDVAEGVRWVGIVAHELGHAIDCHGRGGGPGRSVWLAPALRRDRMRLAEAAREACAPVEPAAALARLPAAVRARLVRLAGGVEAACAFAVAWSGGRHLPALDGLGRCLAARPGGGDETAILARYGLGRVAAFLGAVRDLDIPGGHGRAYYRRHGQILGPELTLGHVAEAFADAFFADVIDGGALYAFLIADAAPATHAAYRLLIARIGAGR